MKVTHMDASLGFKTSFLIDAGSFASWIRTQGKKDVLCFYDQTLPSMYLAMIFDAIPIERRCPLPAKEESKTFATIQTMIAFTEDKDISKSTEVIAIGGGAITDAVSFFASIYQRGLSLTLVPTTLLAMVDASIGGKTAINTTSKNQIGTFYPANQVLIDSDFLKTCSSSLIAEGMSEIIKIGLLFDETFVQALEQKTISLEAMISKAIDLKVKVVSADLNDGNLRQLLNFGHTLGHALEALHQYTIPHGQCVAAGILLETDQSPFYPRIYKLFKQYQCFSPIPFTVDALMTHIQSDKKRNQEKINIMTLPFIGQGTLMTIPLKDLKDKIPTQYRIMEDQ
jgi:3-dehydroquinate synthase